MYADANNCHGADSAVARVRGFRSLIAFMVLAPVTSPGRAGFTIRISLRTAKLRGLNRAWASPSPINGHRWAGRPLSRNFRFTLWTLRGAPATDHWVMISILLKRTTAATGPVAGTTLVRRHGAGAVRRIDHCRACGWVFATRPRPGRPALEVPPFVAAPAVVMTQCPSSPTDDRVAYERARRSDESEMLASCTERSS